MNLKAPRPKCEELFPSEFRVGMPNKVAQPDSGVPDSQFTAHKHSHASTHAFRQTERE